MNILFKGITNKPYSMVMSVVFKLPSNEIIFVSADKITFSVFDSDEDSDLLSAVAGQESEDESEYCNFEMIWHGCYILEPVLPGNEDEGDIERYLTPMDILPINTSELIEFMLHEDTVPCYSVEFENFEAF